MLSFDFQNQHMNNCSCGKNINDKNFENIKAVYPRRWKGEER